MLENFYPVRNAQAQHDLPKATDLNFDLASSVWGLTALPGYARGRHILLDLGSASGVSIKQYLRTNEAKQHHIQVHAFEPDPLQLAQLRTSLTRSKHHERAALHEAAIWVADEQVVL